MSAKRSESQKRYIQEDTFDKEYVDLHCHCLPALDDGPETLEEAVNLCRALVVEQVTIVVATPHQLGPYEGRVTNQRIEDAAATLRDALTEAGIELAVFTGAEIRLDPRIPELLQSGQLKALGTGNSHVLIELPYERFLDPRPVIEQLARQGKTTIVAHVERYPYFQEQPELVRQLAEYGAWLQITASSLLGEQGPVAKKLAWYWLASGLVHVVASDCHGEPGRSPLMAAARQQVEQWLGRKAVVDLFLNAPRQALGQATVE